MSRGPSGIIPLLALSALFTSTYGACNALTHQLWEGPIGSPTINVNQLVPHTTPKPEIVSHQDNKAYRQLPLNSTTWIQLGIDSYLATFPNGTSLNLQEFAAAIGASNFICGIGEMCQAGQLDQPVASPGWEVLFAAQEWNNFQNKFYRATTSVIQSVTDISSSLVADLYDPKDRDRLWKFLSNMDVTEGIIYAMLASLLLTTLGLVLIPTLTVAFLLVLPSLGVLSSAASVVAMKTSFAKKSPMEKFSFYSFHLDQWLHKAQENISQATNRIMYSGVSSSEGISSALKNGTFFRARPSVDEVELTSNLRNTTTVRILTEILRSQNAFVTIESDQCSYRGAYETSKDNDLLTYCSTNGTLFRIIRAGKKKVHKHWLNADLVSKKYGITVKYLTKQSYFCQLNHGSANFNPYRSGNFPSNSSSECLSNLPVCDLRDPDLAKAKNENNLVYACRNVGKLPI